MWFITTCVAIALCVVAVAAGCAGSDSSERDEGKTFVAADLGRFVGVPPMSAGWEWSPNRSGRSFTRDDFDGRDPPYPIQATLFEAHQDAGFVRREESTWRDETKKGSSFATLFESADGAQSAFHAGREFAHRWFGEVEHADVEDVSVEGLGDESWGVRGGRPGHLEFVEYGWRSGNVEFAVYITCGPCPLDIEQAARDWADEIDKETRTNP